MNTETLQRAADPNWTVDVFIKIKYHSIAVLFFFWTRQQIFLSFKQFSLIHGTRVFSLRVQQIKWRMWWFIFADVLSDQSVWKNSPVFFLPQKCESLQEIICFSFCSFSQLLILFHLSVFFYPWTIFLSPSHMRHKYFVSPYLSLLSWWFSFLPFTFVR